MSYNIMDAVKGQINDQLIGQIGGLLGESPEKTRSAIDGALPTLMAGIGEAAQETKGAETLMGLVNNTDDGMLDNIGSMIGGNQASSLIETGTKGLGSLMGNSGVTSMIGGLSSFTGLGKGSAGSLLGMLTPMVLGLLKGKAKTDGLNASGLAGMLKSQGGNISTALPQGIIQHLESAGLGSSGGGSSSGFSGGKVAAAATGLAAGAAGIAGAAAGRAGGAVSGAVDTAGDIAGGVGGAVSGAAGAVGRGVGGAVDAAGDAAGAVGRGVGNAASGAVDAAGNAAGAVGRGVGGAVDAAGDAAGAVGRGRQCCWSCWSRCRWRCRRRRRCRWCCRTRGWQCCLRRS
jgi:hypothetical protein